MKLATKHCPSLQMSELSKIGGPTVKKVVKRMMYKLFENSLDIKYSWEGKKKKKIFRSLLISKVIMDEYLYLIPQFQNKKLRNRSKFSNSTEMSFTFRCCVLK